MELSPELKEEIKNLPKNFNIIKENDDIDYLASRRVEITKYWIPKILKGILYLNIISVSLIFLSTLFLLTKPQPKFFGTTPNVKVIPLKTVKIQSIQQGNQTGYILVR